jgi:hypothetical protein
MRKAVNAKTTRLAGYIVRGMQETPQNRTVSIRPPTAAGAQSSRPPVCDLYLRLQSCGSIVELK